jgi:hypothetical protein
VSVLDVVEDVVSLLLLEVVPLDPPAAPMLPLVELLGALLVELLGVLVESLEPLEPLEPLGALLVLAELGGELLPVLLLEVWPMARPTPPASAAAAASMVRVFLVAFISVLLDMEAPQGMEPPQGRVETKTAGRASWFGA